MRRSSPSPSITGRKSSPLGPSDDAARGKAPLSAGNPDHNLSRPRKHPVGVPHRRSEVRQPSRSTPAHTAPVRAVTVVRHGREDLVPDRLPCGGDELLHAPRLQTGQGTIDIAGSRINLPGVVGEQHGAAHLPQHAPVVAASGEAAGGGGAAPLGSYSLKFCGTAPPTASALVLTLTIGARLAAAPRCQEALPVTDAPLVAQIGDQEGEIRAEPLGIPGPHRARVQRRIVAGPHRARRAASRSGHTPRATPR